MSAKSMCDVGLHQSHEFILALEKAGFDSDLIQAVINDRGNKKAKAMYAAVVGGVKMDNRFTHLTTFEVTVPEGYDHATRLDTFAVAHKSEFKYGYNSNITDANYSKATTKLVPGRKFQVKVFGIKSGEVVTSNDCLVKLCSEKAVLVGAQGASLAYEQGKDKLPKGKWSVSFDEKEALWCDGDYRRVPYVYRFSDGEFSFFLGRFEDGWNCGDCLLCFCDLPAGEAVL